MQNTFLFFALFLPFTSLALTLQEANKQLNSANEFFIAGKMDNAFTIYNNLHMLFPHSIALLQNTARAAYELNNNTYAIQLLERALAQQSENPEVHYQYALSLLTAGDYTNGWKEYEWRWKKSIPDPEKPWDMQPKEVFSGLISCDSLQYQKVTLVT